MAEAKYRSRWTLDGDEIPEVLDPVTGEWERIPEYDLTPEIWAAIDSQAVAE